MKRALIVMYLLALSAFGLVWFVHPELMYYIIILMAICVYMLVELFRMK